MAELKKQTVAGRHIGAMRKDSTGVKKIGYIVLFSINEVEMPSAAVDTFWEKSGSMPDFKPTETEPLAAFQRTFSQNNTSIWQPLDDRKLIAQFAEDGRVVRVEFVSLPARGRHSRSYVLTRRVWVQEAGDNGDERELPNQPNVARAAFDVLEEEDPPFTIEVLDKTYEPLRKKMMAIAQKEYRRQLGIVEEVRIRDGLRRLIKEHNGVKFLGGQGVWFCPLEAEADLLKYQDFLEIVSKYRPEDYPAEMRVVDAIDVPDMREAVARDVKRQAEEAFRTLLVETAETLEKIHAEKRPLEEEAIRKVIRRRLSSRAAVFHNIERYERLLERKIKVELGIPEQLPAGKRVSARTRAALQNLARGVM